MRAAAVLCASFVGGLFVSSMLGSPISFFFAVALAVSGFAVLIFKRKLPMQRLWLCLIVAALGAGWIGLHTVFVYDRAVSHAQTTAQVHATVDDISRYNNGNVCYLVRVHQIDDDHFPASFYASMVCSADIEATYGDQLICTAQLQQAADYGQLLFDKDYSKGVYLTGDIQATAEVVPSFSLIAPFRYLRDACTNLIDTYVAAPMNAVLNGILFGDRSEIPYSIQRDFDRCGVFHILAVSGLHVSIIGAILLAILRAMRVPKKICSIFFICGVFCFVAVAGFTPSALRAGLMAAIAWIGVLCDKKVRAVESLAVAAAVILVLTPYAALGLSFILSFSSCLGILVLADPLTRFMKKKTGCYGKAMGVLLESVCLSVSALLFSAPALILSMGRISWVSVFANLLLIPLIPPLFVLGLATVAFGGFFPAAATILGYLAQGLCGAICSITHTIALFPWCYIPANDSFVPLCLAACGVVLLCTVLFKDRNMLLKHAAICCAVLFAIPAATHWILYKDAITIDVVGSGYGSSAVVHGSGKTVVIGCGGGSWADRQLCQLLDGKGISKVDALILPSSSKQDASGALDFIQEFPMDLLVLDPVMEGGDIETFAGQKGITVLAEKPENIVSIQNMKVATTKATESLAVQVRIDDISIGYSDNISALQALASNEFLNIALIRHEFEGWYGDFTSGCSIILADQENCPENSWLAPPNATTHFVINRGTIAKEGG